MAEIVLEILPWGRKTQATWLTALGSLVLTLGCPTWIVTNWIALEYYGGSLKSTLETALREGLIDFYTQHAPQYDFSALFGYLAWVAFQAALYIYLPGPLCRGQMTPAGNLLEYKTNGLLAWIVTHTMFAIGSATGIINPAIIARNWEGLLVAVNIYGLVVSALCLIKAHLNPSHPGDRKFSGSIIFDYFVGVELNPRLGEKFDLKFFHNGRPGIVAWTLIDLSFMAYQYQTHGYISTSMILVTLFHHFYVLDFFYNEDWYLRTLDISHDHFGYYLCWGSTVLLPNVYTIQVQYLARYPTNLSPLASILIFCLGIGGYIIFRSSNHQKNVIRAASDPSKVSIWGKPATFVKVKYLTEDGKVHQSLLLTSGWWGVARHSNYLSDLMQAFAMCATCGFTTFLPWCYFFFLSAILAHRLKRDEERCARKYGSAWEEYRKQVKWALIPGVY